GNPCSNPPLAIRPYDTASGPGALALPRRQAMSDESPVLTAVDDRGVVTVTLNRPEVNNAYNGAMIDGILAALDAFASIPGARALLLRGNGRHFQAGADLKWITSVRADNEAANLAVSRSTAEAVDRLNHLPVPVVAMVQGGCFGGGTGIVAACDVVVAADDAIFSIAEARWGLHAGIIIPQLNDAMSVRQVRRYALTGERFGAAEAHRVGLVHEVVSRDRLEHRAGEIIDAILQNAPGALARTKAHVPEHAWGTLSDSVMGGLVASHAGARLGEEAGEGLASFVEKRSAAWAPKA